MGAEQRQAHLQQALALTREMVAKAEAEDWGALVEDHRRREQTLDDAFAMPVDESEAPTVRETLEQIQAADEALMERVQGARALLMSEIQQLQNGRQAQQAYQRYKKA